MGLEQVYVREVTGALFMSPVGLIPARKVAVGSLTDIVFPPLKLEIAFALGAALWPFAGSA